MTDTPTTSGSIGFAPVDVDPRAPQSAQYRRPQIISHLTGKAKTCKVCDKPATHVKRRIHEVSPNSLEVSCVTFYYFCGQHNTKS